MLWVVFLILVRDVGAKEPVLDVPEISGRVIDCNRQIQILGCQSTDRLKHLVGRNNLIALRHDEIDAGIEKLLLRIQHIEDGA